MRPQENNMLLAQEAKKLVIKVMKEFQTAGNFIQDKYTDTPTDNLQVVNRKYVNLNGTVANRPNSSVATIGQRYFSTDTNIPMTFNGTNWVNGVGSVVAIN